MQEYSDHLNYTNTNIQINAFDHILECYLPKNLESLTSVKTIPPPYDAWGTEARWKILECRGCNSSSSTSLSSTASSCLEYCTKEGQRKEELKQSLIKNFNIVFGVTRNKVFANYFRAKKAHEMEMEDEDNEAEDEEEEEQEEEEDEEVDDDDELEEEDDDEGDDEEDDEDEEEDEDDEEEEEKQKEESDTSSTSSSSSSSSSLPRKRKGKTSKPKI